RRSGSAPATRTSTATCAPSTGQGCGSARTSSATCPRSSCDAPRGTSSHNRGGTGATRSAPRPARSYGSTGTSTRSSRRPPRIRSSRSRWTPRGRRRTARSTAKRSARPAAPTTPRPAGLRSSDRPVESAASRRAALGHPPAEVAPEPPGRQAGDLLQRARLLEEMGRAGHDDEFLLGAQRVVRLPVQADDDVVEPADDQERRRADLAERVAGQIGAAAAGDDRLDPRRLLRGGDERRRRAGARAEVPDRERGRLRVRAHPLRRPDQTPGEERDVEDLLAVVGLRLREQVEEERADPGADQLRRNETVPRAEPAAPRAVREEDDAQRVLREGERAGEPDPVDR